jgi:Arc/MetJ family transcription regulator
MAKHLVDIDERALLEAKARLGKQTIKETVNEALRLASGERAATVRRRLDVLAAVELAPREQAWR